MAKCQSANTNHYLMAHTPHQEQVTKEAKSYFKDCLKTHVHYNCAGHTHRDLRVGTLYRKHMIVSRVSHQALQALTQRGKRVIRSSWYPCFHEALLCWDTTHKIPTVTVEIYAANWIY